MATSSHAAHVGYILVQSLQRHRTDEVLRIDGRSLTGGEVLDRMSQYTQAFDELGIDSGSTVAILSKNVPEVLYVMGVGWVRGFSRIALHPMGSVDDHAFVLADAGVTTLVVDPGFADRAEQLARTVPGLRVLTIGPAEVGQDINELADRHRPAEIILTPYGDDQVLALAYTGGTTGQPKGVIITARVIAEMTKIQLAEWEWPTENRFLICTPLSHAGASFFLPVVFTGGVLIVQPTFDPTAVLDGIAQERITATFLVPSMIYALLDKAAAGDRDLSSLQTVFYGASSISPTRLAEAIEVFGPVFAQAYGQSEAPMAVTYFRTDEHIGNPERLASCGRPSPLVHTALLDAHDNPVPVGEPGEICVAGPLLAGGYWQRPEATLEAFRDSGWLRTGDIAREDSDGFWYIIDRVKDMIVTGGFNVFPREVEDVIATDPAVRQVAVIGTPDERWGEAVTALVVPHDGVALTDEVVGRITALVKRVKGSVQAPKKVLAVSAIPLTGLGKPDKKALREQFWTGDRRVG